MTAAPTRIAEIIEANTTAFTAESYELYQAPPFGSLLKTGEGQVEVYGVVYDTSTSSIDPGRRPIARGRAEADEAAIYKSNPQLTRLFRTEVSVLIVGHRQGDVVRHYLPPSPPHIHSFVYACTPEEVRRFSQSLHFLNVLLAARVQTPVEELVAASLRHISQAQPDRHAFLVASGKELAVLLSGELNRLKNILRRLQE